MADIWKQIQSLAKQGKQPQITLSPATEILVRKPTRPSGRPRTSDPKLPYKHYASARGRGRPHCLNPGCRAKLTKDQRGGCSDACVDAIINRALMLLHSVRLTKKELMELYNVE